VQEGPRLTLQSLVPRRGAAQMLYRDPGWGPRAGAPAPLGGWSGRGAREPAPAMGVCLLAAEQGGAGGGQPRAAALLVNFLTSKVDFLG